MSEFKERVYQSAIALLKDKIRLLQEERKAISEGILEDSKSSAGDKYETGREMMTQDLNHVESQLKQINLDLEELYRLQSIKDSTGAIREGCLVKLGTDWFLISVSIGQLEVDGEKVFLLSKSSPLGQSLLGKQENDSVQLRGKIVSIGSVF
ncbi:hypothetical protein [Algoriphagus sp. CAU 1675]|uniref:hypothetical protein n=1 Tax=Algoriphagus sp. CAU 1675 TaxID=3032597 RepID=UPI0023D9D131|nr:hypothetical protein [Algoriphagus sp. CAU 1675]MDF2156908.1 hypothetical protein [Algoriphagus sp. CAU 1675]